MKQIGLSLMLAVAVTVGSLMLRCGGEGLLLAQDRSVHHTPTPTVTPTPTPTPAPTPTPKGMVSFPFRIDQPSENSQILYPTRLTTNIVLDDVSAIMVGSGVTSECTALPEVVLVDCIDSSCNTYGIAAVVDVILNPNLTDNWQLSTGTILETGVIPKDHYLAWSPHNDVCPGGVVLTGSASGHVSN